MRLIVNDEGAEHSLLLGMLKDSEIHGLIQ